MITNSDRADWASSAVTAFRKAHAADGDLQTDVKDLISDLCHLLRLELGLKPRQVSNLVDNAVAMFKDETRSDED